MPRPLLSLLLVFAVLAFAGTPVHADSDNDADEDATLDAIHREVEKGTVKPLSDLKAIVAARFPGDIVRIEPHVTHGTYTYEFKVLQQDGKLVEIDLDATTGRILKTENE